jgi:hypothetical protein
LLSGEFRARLLRPVLKLEICASFFDKIINLASP